MSWRSDSSQWVGSGWLSSAYPGQGITGAALRLAAATGANGAGPGYNDWDSGDDAKEFRFVWTSFPASGTFVPKEDGTAQLLLPANGSYTAGYDVWVDGQNIGSAVSTIIVGGSAFSGTVQLGDDLFSGTLTGFVATNFNGTVQLGDDAISGTLTGYLPPSGFSGTVQLGDDAISGSLTGYLSPSSFSGTVQLGDDSFSGTLQASALPSPLCAARIMQVAADVPYSGYDYPTPTWIKDPDEVLDYGFDFSAILAQIPGDTPAGFTVVANAQLQILAAGQVNSGLYGVLVAGGYDGASAEMTCRMSMTSGRVYDATMILRIRPT